MSSYYLPLSEALTKAKITKGVLKEFTGYTDAQIAHLETEGVDIINADKVATYLGYHPSELWTGWAELLFQVLQWREEDVDEDE